MKDFFKALTLLAVYLAGVYVLALGVASVLLPTPKTDFIRLNEMGCSTIGKLYDNHIDPSTPSYVKDAKTCYSHTPKIYLRRDIIRVKYNAFRNDPVFGEGKDARLVGIKWGIRHCRVGTSLRMIDVEEKCEDIE